MEKRKITKFKQFIIVLAAFVILGIPFKVMVLLEGFTEVRPVNAIPPVAGLMFGQIGAFACGIGNVISDFFGSFNLTSLLGFFANLIAAFLPYRLWYIYSDESPNFHKNINLLKYVFISFISAVTVAWTLEFGLYYLFGTWIESVFTYVLLNNFCFSVGLGVPLLIMITAEVSDLEFAKKPKRYVFLKWEKMRKIFPCIYGVLMVVMLICVSVLHLSPDVYVWLNGISALGFLGLVMLLI